ncbi:FimD/PapC C-terminal domain-containing protein [Pseudomonas lundensis]|uniref:FimD/PapC C-terminal domain-containing protein n=1 Tax=Pseudomonas lundensis TaxID=86185 RepID=UPI0030BA0B5E
MAPYAGAAVKITFKTRSGNALLVKALLPGNQAVPMGADVLDETGSVIGMVGQGSQAYLRSEKPAGALTLRWGDRPEEQCALHYDVSGRDLDQPLLRVTSDCRPVDSSR